MRVEATVACRVFDSFRVRQVAGMFDLPLKDEARETFVAEVPHLDQSWQVGLIVGPSGSGKSTIARQAFGNAVYEPADWPTDRALVDCLGDRPIQELTNLLTAVGLSSPPAWLKPYHVLSGGERFRCDLARALAQTPPDGLVVFDEFTSVVDRQVAQFGSAAVRRALRRGQIACRFVAVTCHYDVEPWLEPDWTLDMASRQLAWRSLRRPAITLQLHRCHRQIWTLFKPHHYLSGALNPAARCYVASWNDAPVVFCALLPQRAYRDEWRVSRLVTLPDYQGLGLGLRAVEALAGLYGRRGQRLAITAAHPAVIVHCARSERWKLRRMSRARQQGAATGRAQVSFVYCPENGVAA